MAWLLLTSVTSPHDVPEVTLSSQSTPVSEQPHHSLDDGDALTDIFAWSVSSLTRHEHRASVLRVTGEIDLFTAAQLREALTTSLDCDPERLIVDMSQLTYCGVKGFTLLELANCTAMANKIDYVIAGCPTSLLHIWSLLQDACLPIRYPTVAQALSADLPGPRCWDETTGWHGDDVAGSSLTCCDDARRYADPA